MSSVSGIANVRRIVHAFSSPGLLIISFCFIVFFWLRAFTVEPFDSFESLHRLLADEVKGQAHSLMSGSSWESFAGSASHIHSTLLASLSGLLDGAESEVSAFSGRVLSVFLSLLMLWCLHSSWKVLFTQRLNHKFEERRLFNPSLSPVYFTFLNAPLLVASVLVVADLVYVLCAVVYLARQYVSIVLFWDTLKFSWREQGLITMALVGAALTGGWPGYFLLILCSSIFIFSIWNYFRSQDVQGAGWGTVRSLSKLVVFQSLSALFLFLIVRNSLSQSYSSDFLELTSPFTSELSREYSFGSVLSDVAYFLFFVGICFSYSIALLLYSYAIDSASYVISETRAAREGQANRKMLAQQVQSFWFLSLTIGWLVCVFLFDSLFGALFFGGPMLSLWIVSLRKNHSLKIVNRYRSQLFFIAHLINFFLPTVLLFAGVAFFCMFQFDFNWNNDFLGLMLSSSVLSLIERSSYLGVSLALAGFLSLIPSVAIFHWACACMKRKRRSMLLLHCVIKLAILVQTVVAVVLLVGVVTEAEDILTDSLKQTVNKAKLYLGPDETLATASLFAPNVASYFGGSVIMRKDTAEDLFENRSYSVILTPEWNIGLCEKHGYDIAAGVEFYRLCLRSYKSTLEGPQH